MAGKTGRTGRIPTAHDRNSVNENRPRASWEGQLRNQPRGRLQSIAEHLDANMSRWIGREPFDRNPIEWIGRPASWKAAERTESGR